VVREGAAVSINADANDQVSAFCEPGEVATGGGMRFGQVDPKDMLVVDQYPGLHSFTGLVRNLDADNNNAGALQVRAVVACASP
jgi:hypothetical protein